MQGVFVESSLSVLAVLQRSRHRPRTAIPACTRAKGIVVNAPSIVAINKVNCRIAAVRKDARNARPDARNIVAIKPMGTVIATRMRKMLPLHQEAHNRHVLVRPPRLGVPSGNPQVEKRA